MSFIAKGLRLVSGLQGVLIRPSCQTNSQMAAILHQSFHTSQILDRKERLKKPSEPKRWPKYNDIVYPPQKEGEPPRPAEIVHFRSSIKYSTKKLWYTAAMIRGMSIDEAMKQLSFHKRKGAAVINETLLEAQAMAVKDHNVEYKSNLWIEDSFVGKATTILGFRKQARRRPGTIHYRYTHYFVRLREGRPPKYYYPPPPTGQQLLENKLRDLRARRVVHAL